MIHSPDLTPDDMQAICTHAKGVMEGTDSICASTSLRDMDAHQGALEQAQSGLDSLENYLVREINALKASLDTVKSMEKDIDRHFARTKRSYWSCKNASPIHP